MTDFNRFVADNAGNLLRSAYLITSDLHEAEDLVQETLMKVARRWHKVGRMEHPLAYARRILVNLAIDDSPKRTRKRAELAPGNDTGGGGRDGEARPRWTAAPGDPATDAIDRRNELVQALATLPPRQRAVLVLRYFLDLPEAEVAAALGCSLGTVKSSASRGLARLEGALRPATATRSMTR
jgi:RNA polymerase sigma-70 factor (sigma-E family)